MNFERKEEIKKIREEESNRIKFLERGLRSKIIAFDDYSGFNGTQIHEFIESYINENKEEINELISLNFFKDFAFTDEVLEGLFDNDYEVSDIVATNTATIEFEEEKCESKSETLVRIIRDLSLKGEKNG